jgi:hypothetical protein
VKSQSTSVKLGPTFSFPNLISADDAETALQTLDHNLPKSQIAVLRNFNRAYLIITQKVRQSLKKQAFENAGFLNKFDARFVNYYIRAVENYSTGAATPKAWEIAFDAAKAKSFSPLIVMALGINAHINNDISQVLLDTKAGPEHYRDYAKVNDIIQSSIYEVIDDLDNDSSLFNPKHRLLQPWYKFFMNCLARIWRRSAWRKYQKLRSGSLTIERIEFYAERMAKRIQKLPL